MAYFLVSGARRERLVLGDDPAFGEAGFAYALLSKGDPVGEVHAHLVEGGMEPEAATRVAWSCADFAARCPDWRVEVL